MSGTGKTRLEYIQEIKLLQNSGASAEEINKLRGEYLNNANKPNTVAAEINQLRQQGASDQEINTFVTSRGYSEQDFNIDQEGRVRPMEGTRDASSGRVLGVDYDRPTSQDIADQRAFDRLDAGLGQPSNSFYENSAASAAVIGNRPETTTVTTTTTTNFQQVSGGASATTYRIPPRDTTDSLVAKQDAARAETLQQAYQLNPNDAFDKNILNEQLTSGKITQNDYNNIVNSTPEQRDQKSLEYAQQYQQARERESAAQLQYDPVVVTAQTPNTSSITVTNETTVTESSTVIPTQITTSSTSSIVTLGETPLPVATVIAGQQSQSSLPVNTGDIVIPADSTGVATVIANRPDPTPVELPLVDQFGTQELTGIDPQLTTAELFGPQQTIGIDSEEQLLEREFERQRQIDEAAINARIQSQTIVQPEIDTGLTGVATPRSSPLQVEIDTGLTEIRPQSSPLQVEIDTGLTGEPTVQSTRRTAPEEATVNWKSKSDWRVRLSLAPSADYLYRANNAGILSPLKETDGVLFPYTPKISVGYNAAYSPSDIAHTNYKFYSYSNSSIDNVNISCEFTAQDTFEANYLLAVIHFFRSVTKMFYGRDQNPRAGTPPPLCYLYGMGEFQFNAHPLVVSNFTYSLPTDVDYIRTNSQRFLPGSNQSGLRTRSFGDTITESRLGPNLRPGATQPPPNFSTQTGENITYVPTMMSIEISAFPIVTRNDVSNNFSLKDYATGSLLQGTRRRAGGIW